VRARPGSEAHKQLFCKHFMQSHRAYDPRDLSWPELDTPTLERLRALPFWGEALSTEQETGAKIVAYARTVADPLLRDAIAMQGVEEERHALFLETLMERYGIVPVRRPVAALPARLEQAFVDAGYGECVDSFFAFGLFDVASRSGFFPPALLDVVEPILSEEARHIVFFANWEAHTQARTGHGLLVLRAARSIRYYVRAARQRLGVFRNAGGPGFTAGGARTVTLGLTPEHFLETCLRENAWRLAAFPPELLRPRLVPALARLALRGLRLAARRPANPRSGPLTRHGTGAN
jgi:hypothetical protein